MEFTGAKEGFGITVTYGMYAKYMSRETREMVKTIVRDAADELENLVGKPLKKKHHLAGYEIRKGEEQ